MTTIAASFAVGFPDLSWQHVGPYYGDGETFEKACLDALCKCAVDFEECETKFMTFLGKPVVVERPNALDGKNAPFVQQNQKVRGDHYVGSSHRNCASRR